MEAGPALSRPLPFFLFVIPAGDLLLLASPPQPLSSRPERVAVSLKVLDEMWVRKPFSSKENGPY
jgi:hypothetical protein